jgi:hypothetical protein
MNTQTQTQQTNDLRHNILAHDVDGNPMYIKIRLNDECKNGHQDFAITGDIYQKGKPKTDRYFLAGGCIHEDIIKARPDLKIFVDLHLCDYKGIPMYAVENGFYHLRNGFNNTKPEDKKFKAEFCEYYRITSYQFDVLNKTANTLQYALALQSLGILKQWELQAIEAIKLLEKWTDKPFLVDSVKSQYHAPTEEQLKEEETKQATGYYTPEAEQQREIAKRDGIIEKLAAERDKEILKATTEYEVKRQVLIYGGEKALSNCIFYTHSNTLSFNWRGYDRISEELITKITEEIQLPEGVKIENKKA